MNLDTADLRAADPQLYEWLVSYPKEVIPAFDQALRQIAVEELGVDYDYIFIVSMAVTGRNPTWFHQTTRVFQPIDKNLLP